MSEVKVLATVEGTDITDEEVQNFIQHLGPQAAMQFSNPEGIKQVAGELINQELLFLEAKKLGLDKEEDFLKELEKVQKNVLKQYAINNLMAGIEVTEEETEKFYEENKEMFQTEESARASHILVETKEKAKEIIEEIKAGLGFDKAAEKYSSCPSNERGGDLGEFGRGQMVPEFEEATFALDVDEISEPVETQHGFHIIKVASKKEAGISPYIDVKDQIKQQVIAMKQQEIYLNKAEELKKEFKVETFF